MDLCHLKRKNAIGDKVSLQGEQGSSASQMTAAKVMDSISRLSGCAASLEKNGRCTKKTECPRHK